MREVVSDDGSVHDTDPLDTFHNVDHYVAAQNAIIALEKRGLDVYANRLKRSSATSSEVSPSE